MQEAAVHAYDYGETTRSVTLKLLPLVPLAPRLLRIGATRWDFCRLQKG